MNTKSFIKCGCLLPVAAITLLATSTGADIPAFALGSVLTNQPSTFTGTKGWEFIATDRSNPTAIAITQLGVFDNGGDGLMNSHQIGLWRRDDGTLLASATVPAGTVAPLVAGYRYVPILPVVIPRALGVFVVAAQYSAGDADDLVTPRPSTSPFGAFQFAPDISVSPFGGRFGLGSDLPFPLYQTIPPCPEGCVGEWFWEPNLQYVIVPEPSVWLLLSPALICLLLREHKPQRRQ